MSLTPIYTHIIYTFFAVPETVQNLTCNGNTSPASLSINWLELIENSESILGYRVEVSKLQYRLNESHDLQSISLTPPYEEEVKYTHSQVSHGLGQIVLLCHYYY